MDFSVRDVTSHWEMQLNVKVISGSEIPAMDPNGKSDPYCLLKISSSTQTWRTKVRVNTLSPVWNDTFAIPVAKEDEDVLKVMLYDKDGVSSDDFISETEIKVSKLSEGKVKEKEYKFKGGKGKAGKVKMQVQLAKKGKTPFAEY